MCLKCQRHAIQHLTAIIEAGKNVPVTPAKHFTPEQADEDARSMPLMGGRMAEMLRLTMVNGTDDDGEAEFQINDRTAGPLTGYVSVLPTAQVWSLALMFGFMRAQADITEDVLIDALKARALQGDGEALGYLGPESIASLARTVIAFDRRRDAARDS